MFTGIIEQLAEIKKIEKEGTNVHFTLSSGIEGELYIDQSIAHNGVCLTVVNIADGEYIVTAIHETMIKTNLGKLSVGDKVNLERCVQGITRMDGHIVQGHVDTTTKCLNVEEVDGSWYYTFHLPEEHQSLIVDKGSVCINGVSLTVVDPKDDTFKVAIIPYTYEHTNFHSIQSDSEVNLEFDIIGKYVARYMDRIHK